jgi:hypothetical protein
MAGLACYDGFIAGGAQIFKTSRSDLEIVGARWVKRLPYPQISNATIYNSVAQVTWHPGFGHLGV